MNRQARSLEPIQPDFVASAPAIPWEDRPPGATAALWRSSRNPIIARDHLPRSNSIFNSAVVPFGAGFAGVFRIDDTSRTMNIHAGRSADGIDWQIDEQPIAFVPADARVAEIQEVFQHAYDPRVTWLEDRYYVTWCNGYHGPTIGVAYTHDFATFHQLDNAYLPFNRNGVLFPRRIGDRYVMLSRPSDNGHTPFGDIFCSESPDLDPLGTAPARDRDAALDLGVDEDRRGPDRRSRPTRAGSSSTTACSPPATGSSTRWARPCSTSRSRGASSRVRRDYLLSPQVPYEQVGDVPNVVFPCAALVEPETDRLTVYYGGADTVVCMAHGYLSELLQFVRS